MRVIRRESMNGKSEFIVFVYNGFKMDVEPLTLEGREIVRGILFAAAEKTGIEILAWCITPVSYRMIIKTEQGFASRKTEQRRPLVKFQKRFQQRVASWVKYTTGRRHGIWRDRYKLSQLHSRPETIVALASVDAFPMIVGLVDEPEDYFFTSYYHACLGDKDARKGLLDLLGTPSASWSVAKRRYKKILIDLTKDCRNS